MQPEQLRRSARTFLLLAALCAPPALLALLPVALSASQSHPDIGDLRRNTVRFDELGRLVAYPGKEEVACPAQTGRTAVLLVAGQSNAANHAERRYASRYGKQVVGLFGNHCTLAQSPLLGSSGEWGEIWTPLADRLIASGAWDQVVIVPAAVGGSSADLWVRGGRLHPVLMDAVAGAHESRYTITHVLWYQGESDYFAQTPASTYQAELTDIFDSMRSADVHAPVYVAVATRCNAIAPDWSRDNPIAHVQRTFAQIDPSVHTGFDADTLIAVSDRYDNCHLGSTGVEKAAASWAKILHPQHAGR